MRHNFSKCAEKDDILLSIAIRTLDDGFLRISFEQRPIGWRDSDFLNFFLAAILSPLQDRLGRKSWRFWTKSLDDVQSIRRSTSSDGSGSS